MDSDLIPLCGRALSMGNQGSSTTKKAQTWDLRFLE
jgi:hypothetical protein